MRRSFRFKRAVTSNRVSRKSLFSQFSLFSTVIGKYFFTLKRTNKSCSVYGNATRCVCHKSHENWKKVAHAAVAIFKIRRRRLQALLVCSQLIKLGQISTTKVFQAWLIEICNKLTCKATILLNRRDAEPTHRPRSRHRRTKTARPRRRGSPPLLIKWKEP